MSGLKLGDRVSSKAYGTQGCISYVEDTSKGKVRRYKVERDGSEESESDFLYDSDLNHIVYTYGDTTIKVRGKTIEKGKVEAPAEPELSSKPAEDSIDDDLVSIEEMESLFDAAMKIVAENTKKKQQQAEQPAEQQGGGSGEGGGEGPKPYLFVFNVAGNPMKNRWSSPQKCLKDARDEFDPSDDCTVHNVLS